MFEYIVAIGSARVKSVKMLEAVSLNPQLESQ